MNRSDVQILAPAVAPAAVRIAMTGREGGVSTGEFRSLNLGYHVPDDPEAVAHNRARAAEALRLPGRRAVFGDQVHGTRVARVEVAQAGAGWGSMETALPQTDGLVTTTPGLALGILVADCFPLAVWDSDAGALGVAHCGWRGVAGGIMERLVEALVAAGAEPLRCGAWIGAGIGACCFEVGAEVLDCIPGVPAERSTGDRWRVDLAGVIGQRLKAAGLAGDVVEVGGACTSCDEARFFSHRRATRAGAASTGRQALFASLEAGS